MEFYKYIIKYTLKTDCGDSDCTFKIKTTVKPNDVKRDIKIINIFIDAIKTFNNVRIDKIIYEGE